MKKLIIGLGIFIVMVLTSCAVHTSDNIDVDAKDIKYIKDNRTGLCYGIVASRKTMSTDATGLGMTCVPCEKVEHLIEE